MDNARLHTNKLDTRQYADGAYAIEAQGLNVYYDDFRALKEVSILSMVLKPLTWAFHAELTGTRAKNEWTLRTALRKIFSLD